MGKEQITEANKLLARINEPEATGYTVMAIIIALYDIAPELYFKFIKQWNKK